MGVGPVKRNNLAQSFAKLYFITFWLMILVPAVTAEDYLGMMTRFESNQVHVFTLNETGTINFTQTLTTNAIFENSAIKVDCDGRLGIIHAGDVLTSFLVDENQQVQLADSWEVETETGGRFWGIPGLDYVDDYQMVLAQLVSPATFVTLNVHDDGGITSTGHEMLSSYGVFLGYVPRTTAFFEVDTSPSGGLAQLEILPDGSMSDLNILFETNAHPIEMAATRKTRTFVGLGSGTYDIVVLQGDAQSNFVIAQELELPDSWNYVDLYISFNDRYALATFSDGAKPAVLLEFQSDRTLQEVDAVSGMSKAACAITPDSRFAVIGEIPTVSMQEIRVYEITHDKKLQLLPDKTIFVPFRVSDLAFIPPIITAAHRWDLYQ